MTHWPGNNAPTGQCLIGLADIFGAYFNPTLASNFLTPGYIDPPPWALDPAWSIEIYYSPTDFFEFGWFYSPGSMNIRGYVGQKGQFSFELNDDYSQANTDFPFNLLQGMYVIVRNWAKTWTYAAGHIQYAPKTCNDEQLRADGTEQGVVTVYCDNLYAELERKPVKRTYNGPMKLGFLLKDALTRFTSLDTSEIDTTIGINIEYKRFTTELPSQVLEWACNLMNWTYIIDPSTRKIKVFDKVSGACRLPVKLTDTNLYDFFTPDKFEVTRSSESIKNMVEFNYNEKYFLGNVSVSSAPASDVVAAVAGNTVDWASIPPGVNFYIQNGDALYNVDRNLTVGLTKELRISSVYKEANSPPVVGVPAYVSGWRRTKYFADQSSINFMSALRGDDGVFTLILTEDTNNFLPSEARQFALAQLALAQPQPRGSAEIDNCAWPFLFYEGSIIGTDLNKRKSFQGDVTINSLEIQCLAGELETWETADGYRHPKVMYKMGFSPTYNQNEAQIRKIKQDQRRVKVNDLREDTQSYTRLVEQIAVKDCVHLERVGVHQGVYYTESAYVTDWGHYSFAS